MEPHSCLNCGKRVTWQFALCSACEKIYGNKTADWPEWLAFLWRDTQRMRREDVKVKTNEVPFSDISDDLCADELFDEGSDDE